MAEIGLNKPLSVGDYVLYFNRNLKHKLKKAKYGILLGTDTVFGDFGEVKDVDIFKLSSLTDIDRKHISLLMQSYRGEEVLTHRCLYDNRPNVVNSVAYDCMHTELRVGQFILCELLGEFRYGVYLHDIYKGHKQNAYLSVYLAGSKEFTGWRDGKTVVNGNHLFSLMDNYGEEEKEIYDRLLMELN